MSAVAEVSPGDGVPAVDPAELPDVDTLLDAAVADIGGNRRAGQHAMANAVDAAFGGGAHLVVQAGTGTGKSLAYLVPAIRHAMVSGTPVVVATATLALQHQLISRDLPRLAAALAPLLPREPRFAVMKGRSNYACLLRLSEATGVEPTAPDDPELGDLGPDLLGEAWATPAPAAAMRPGSRPGSRPASRPGTPPSAGALTRDFQRVQKWADRTAEGDREELEPAPDQRVWAAVSVSGRECIGPSRCPHATACFAERARDRARRADVVVTNHALLAIGTLEGIPVLPEHELVVIDEAHELVDRVTGAATDELSAGMIGRAVTASRRLLGAEVADELDSAGSSLFSLLAQVPDGTLEPVEAPTHAGRPPLDSTSAASTTAPATAYAVPPHGLFGPLASLRDITHTAVILLAKESATDTEAVAARTAAKAALELVHDVAGRVLACSPTEVTWLAHEERRGAVLRVAPLMVDGLLAASLLTNATVVLTSATLTLGGKFDAIARSVGLSGSEAAPADEPAAAPAAAPPDGPPTSTPRVRSGAKPWRSLDAGSPFNYQRQGILYVAAHLPPPGRDGTSPQALAELLDLVSAAGGRTLGLFSSRRAVQSAAAALRSALDLPILVQGEDGLTSLVRQFAAVPESVLLGTMSLWQGVDVPGESCSLVVVDRLPFPRPDDPVVAGRQRLVDRRGGSGFAAVSVPRAGLMLAQGVGRLIRSDTDRGVVAVLDPRLHTARYGALIRAGLPPFWYTTDPQAVRGALARLSGSSPG